MTISGSSTNTQPEHELGVLWVHGIGEQLQGDALTQMGSPVVEWLEGVLRPDSGRLVAGEAQIEYARLKQAPSVDDPPANAQVRVRIFNHDKDAEPGTPDKVADQRWLFAEGWWGGQVIEPKVSLFLAWMVTRGPWMLLFHLRQCLIEQPWFRPRTAAGRFISWVERRLARWHLQGLWNVFESVGKAVLVLLAWNVGALIVVTLWLAVSLVALVPIGRLRSAVLAVMRSLARVVGDSYVLVRDPTQRAALSSEVLAAAKWLRPQCKKMVIVAHSQGAAVACDAMNATDAPRIDTFITVGAGLVKLHALLRAEARRPLAFLWAGLVAPVLAASVMVGTRLLMQPDPAGYLWLAAVGLLIVGLAAVVVVWESVNRVFSYLGWPWIQQVEPRQHRLRWLDFFSPLDPVPNGTIVATIKKVNARSVPVAVQGSMTGDHTGYWGSRADFIPRLVREFARLADIPQWAVPGDAQSIFTLRRDYRARLPLLVRARRSEWLALILPCVAATDRLLAVIGNLRESLDGLGIENLSNTLGALDGFLGRVAATVLSAKPEDPKILTDVVIFVGVIWLLMTMWRAVFLAVWRWWAELEVVTMLSGTSSTPQGAWRQFLDQCVGLVGAAPLLLSLVWTYAPQYLTEAVVVTGLAIVGGAVVVYLMANLSIEAVVNFMTQWRQRRHRQTPDDLIDSLQQLIGVATIVAAFAIAAYAWFTPESFWNLFGATCAIGAVLAFLARAAVHFALQLRAWRSLTVPPARAWRMLVVPPTVALGVAAALAAYWGWLPASIGAGLAFSAAVSSAR